MAIERLRRAFVDAVLRCPGTHSEEYRRAFLAAGG